VGLVANRDGGDGYRAGRRSLRVNDRFRISIRWTGSDAEGVEIAGYQ
jgi:plasmid maintenance system killer protein